MNGSGHEATSMPPRRSHWRWLRRLLTLAFFVLVPVLLFLLVKNLDWQEVRHALGEYRPATLFLGLLLAAAGYTVFSSFDLLSRYYIGHSLPKRRVFTVAFVCNAFNLNLSSWVGAVALRYRLYSRLGLDIAPALAAAGLQADQLNDNRQRLPGEAHERLLGYFCEHSGDPLFGLHSARFVQPGSWSVLGYIAMNCATLGEAMSRITPYEKLVGDMGTSRIEAAGGQVRLIWNCRHQTPLVRRHMVEHVLASWVLYARWIADLEGSPDEVWLEHDLPDGTRVEDYETFFGCPVRFAQPCSALLVPLDYLALPLRQADATLLRTLEEHALALMAELDDDEPLPLRVKNALRQLLKDGLPRKERVAEKFGMTVRTLQRHLQQAGSSYQQTLDELRRELAEHYLLHSELPIQDIAQYLGFTESRSFHRSFKGWTGQTPGEYRQRRKEPAAQ